MEEEEVVVVAVVVAVVWVGPVAVLLSKRFLSWSIEQEANVRFCKKNNQVTHTETGPRNSNNTHHILLDTIGNALNDVLYHGPMVALRFVVTIAHHSPMFAGGIPTHLNDAVIDLFATGLHAGQGIKLFIRRTFLLAARDIPFPLIVGHMHYVPGFIRGFRTLAATPGVKSKNGLRVQVRFAW